MAYDNIYVDTAGRIVNAFGSMFEFLTETQVLGVPLILMLVGGSIGAYVTYVVAKWIIDIIP